MAQPCSQCEHQEGGYPTEPFSFKHIKINPAFLFSVRVDDKIYDQIVNRCLCYDIRTLYVELQRSPASPLVYPLTNTPLYDDTIQRINGLATLNELPKLKLGKRLTADETLKINAWIRLNQLPVLEILHPSFEVSGMPRQAPVVSTIPQIPSEFTIMTSGQLNALIGAINANYQSSSFGSAPRSLQRLYNNTKNRVFSAQDAIEALKRLEATISYPELFSAIIYARVYNKEAIPGLVPGYRYTISPTDLDYYSLPLIVKTELQNLGIRL